MLKSAIICSNIEHKNKTKKLEAITKTQCLNLNLSSLIRLYNFIPVYKIIPREPPNNNQISLIVNKLIT